MKSRYSARFIFFPLFILVLVSGLFGCEKKSEYEQMVERELNKEVRHDSLFLGYTFGMDNKKFFDHSWTLNQEHIVTGGSQVEYQLEDLSSPARMVFYPEFHNNQIFKMPVEISYKSWAPWNKELHSDSLIIDLVDYYSDVYKSEFIKMPHPEYGQEAWINVKGNRRISIFRKDEMTVRVEFLDLSVKGTGSKS